MHVNDVLDEKDGMMMDWPVMILEQFKQGERCDFCIQGSEIFYFRMRMNDIANVKGQS